MIVIGGANGSATTTLAREYISVEELPYLRANLIAYELNPNDVESVAIEAGRIFIQKIAQSIDNGESFIVESTLSGMGLRKWIGKAREVGYHVTLLFVYLDSAETCIQRVAMRIKKGAHFVPEDEIVRRYERSNQNFGTLIRNLRMSGHYSIMEKRVSFRSRPV